MRFRAFDTLFRPQKHKKRSFCAFECTNDRQNYQIIANLGNYESTSADFFFNNYD